MQSTIEPMREGDVEVVAGLRFVEFFEGTARTLDEDAGDMRRLLTGDGDDVALVARLGGSVVGSILLVRHELEAAHRLTPWLAGLVVAPDHRGQGIGTALVKAIEAHAALLGIDVLYLYTWQARDFYAGLGWKKAETFEQHGTPMLLMSRTVAS